MNKAFKVSLILLAVLLLLIGLVEKNHAIAPEENEIIFPGRGVGPIRLNEPMPGRLPFFMKKSIDKGEIMIEFSRNKTVKKIIITSDRFFVAVSELRVDHNNAGDIIRFYGGVHFEPISNDRIALMYPSRGIDFEIDRFSETIKVIIINMPVEKPRLPKEEYRQYREQFKQR